MLFDLDGTLVDTIELILSSHEHTLREHLRSPRIPSRSEIILNLGRSLPDTLLDYAEADRAANAAEMAEQMLQTYRDYQKANHDHLIRPFEGMREVLIELRNRGYGLGVVTSKMQVTARLALDTYDLGDLLPLGVFWEDTKKHKPDPAPLLEAVRKGGLVPARTVYIGDSIHDIAAGKAAGMKTIAALWGPFDPRDLQLVGPDTMAKSPRDLLEILQ